MIVLWYSLSALFNRMKIQIMLLSLVWVGLLLGQDRPSIVCELNGGKRLKS